MKGMNATMDYRLGQILMPFAPRPVYRLSEIEEILRKSQICGSEAPSRQTLCRWCQEGILETTTNGVEPPGIGFLVFQDSFWRWAKKMQGLPVEE